MHKQNKNILPKHLSTILPLLAVGFLLSFGFLSVVEASGISTSEVITLANKARANSNLAPLIENETLSRAAKAKAKDMIENDYFAHTSPKGVNPWYWMKKEGYEYKYAGENLAINYTSAKDQHTAWMKSSSHRDNILNGNYKEIGVAVVEGKIDGESSLVTVELFGSPLHPVAVSTPAVKAAETEVAPAPLVSPVASPVLDTNMNVAPISFESVSPLAIQDTRILDMAIIVMLILIAFSLIMPPLVFLSQAYLHLSPTAKKENPIENTLEKAHSGHNLFHKTATKII